ncbi:MAG: AAA family ATPase [Sulfolobales archaeon]
MRFKAENYGPQAYIDIELGDMITLFVGSNNTGKSFVSRAIYAILKSCKGSKCDTDTLATLLLNSSIASAKDLWVLSRNFNGRFSLILEDKDSIKIKIDYDRNRHNPLAIEIEGDIKAFPLLYAPSYRVTSLGLTYMFAAYVIEFRDLLQKLISQIITAFGGMEEKGFPMIETLFTGSNTDLLNNFVKTLLSAIKPLIEQREEVLKAAVITLSPTILDVSIAIRTAEKTVIDDHLRTMFKKLFPEFPYKALGFYSERADLPEIPPYLLSSGMIQTLPLLCLLNLALQYIKQGYERVLVFIDEPEINLEMLRQTIFSRALMDFIYATYREGRKISVVIATHSDFITYSITQWLARSNLRNLARVYEFKPGGIEEREIDEHGEVEIEAFSKAIRKVFFEEEFKEE